MKDLFLPLFLLLASHSPGLRAQEASPEAVQHGTSQSSPLWARGLERVHSLYLWRGELEQSALLDSVMVQLEHDIPWLMVQADGDHYRLSFGSVEELGVLAASDHNDVEDALHALQQMLSQAPHGLPKDLDLDISIMKGISRALDRHSKLLHGEKLTSFDKRLRGTLSGIGARMKIVEKRLRIVEVYDETPAGRAGLAAGDRILRIDDVSTLGMSLNDAVDRITGERGSEVSLLVERQEGAVSVQLEMTLVRAEIKIPNVSGRPLQKGIGYVRIDHFSERTVDNLRRVLRKLERDENLEHGLVIDLRGNTGGSMIQSARAADLFLSDGELVRTEGPSGKKVRGLVHRLVAQREIRDFQMPIVILQNQRTASGAEILAGALQESGRAILVGGRSFGKGSVQKVYTLRKDARFKLTVARYLVAGYREIADVGLKPDVPLGRLLLNAKGIQYSPSNLEHGDGLSPLYYVERGSEWVPGLEGEEREDYGLDVAQAILLGTPSAAFSDLISTASVLTEGLQKEEEATLVSQMALRGLDWGLADIEGETELNASATLHLQQRSPRAGERVDLEVVAWNKGDAPIARLVAVLSSSDRVFDGLRIPLGWAGPGEEVRSTIRVDLPASRTGRESAVELFLEDSSGQRVAAGEQLVGYQGSGAPPVALDVQLQKGEDQSSARIRVRNFSKEKLQGLRVRFMHPESAGVELLEYEAKIGVLSAGARGEGRMALKHDPDAEVLPLRVLVEAEGHGRIAEWDLALDTDGRWAHLDAPRIEPVFLPTRMEAGPASLRFTIEDDRELESVIGYVGGEKLAYMGGGSPNMQLIMDVILDEGPNSVAVRAVDKQGLETTRSWVVQGQPVSPTTDAEAKP